MTTPKNPRLSRVERGALVWLMFAAHMQGYLLGLLALWLGGWWVAGGAVAPAVVCGVQLWRVWRAHA